MDSIEYFGWKLSETFLQRESNRTVKKRQRGTTMDRK